MMIGLIYKITDNTCGSVYYGSTTQTISRRMKGHRSQYKAWVGGKGYNCKSFDILKNNDYSCSLVEQVECENKVGLLQRERWWIENNECINKNIPARSREERKEQVKEYDQTNKEQIREYNKQYRQQHQEQICERRRQHYQQNKERIKERQTEYYQKKKAEKLQTII